MVFLRRTLVGSLLCLVAACSSSDREPNDRLPGTPIPLTTGTWRPGDDASVVGLNGTLAISESGCLYLRWKGRRGTNVVWPASYTAQKTNDGTVDLRNQDGAVVAHLGTRIETGGYPVESAVERDSFTPLCTAPINGGWFVVQDEIPPL